jgi:hypothetical protein
MAEKYCFWALLIKSMILFHAEALQSQRVRVSFFLIFQFHTPIQQRLFLKCYRHEDVPQYTRFLRSASLSHTYRLLENTAERIQVLQGLKQIGSYSGFRSYEVHLKPPYRLRGGFGGGVLVPHNIGKCCILAI